MLDCVSDETVRVFGYEMPLREVVYLVRFAITKRWRDKADLCLAMRQVDFDEIEGETFEVIWQQQRNDKWDSRPCKPSTAIAKCAWYAMGNILRRRKHVPITGSIIRDYHLIDEREGFLVDRFPESHVERAVRLLPRKLGRLIKTRYGGRSIVQIRDVAKRLRIIGRVAVQLERDAIDRLREIGDELFA